MNNLHTSRLRTMNTPGTPFSQISHCLCQIFYRAPNKTASFVSSPFLKEELLNSQCTKRTTPPNASLEEYQWTTTPIREIMVADRYTPHNLNTRFIYLNRAKNWGGHSRRLLQITRQECKECNMAVPFNVWAACLAKHSSFQLLTPWKNWQRILFPAWKI